MLMRHDNAHWDDERSMDERSMVKLLEVLICSAQTCGFQFLIVQPVTKNLCLITQQ